MRQIAVHTPAPRAPAKFGRGITFLSVGGSKMPIRIVIAAVLTMASTILGAGKRSGSPGTTPVQQPSGAPVRLPFTAMQPTVFGVQEKFLLATIAPIGKPDPLGEYSSLLTLRRLELQDNIVVLHPYQEVILASANSISPEYALTPAGDFFHVAYTRTSPASDYLLTGTVDLGKGQTPIRSVTGSLAKQFLNGKEMPIMEQTCPEALSFVRGEPNKDGVALSGLVESKVTLLVRHTSGLDSPRWEAIRGVSQQLGRAPRGAWLASDRIAVVWIAGHSEVHKHRVMLGVVAKGKAANGAEMWDVVERREIHTGPASQVDIVRTKNGVLLGIMELGSKAPRVVVYEGTHKASDFRVSGAMPLGIAGAPVAFTLDESATQVAGILSTGYRKDYVVFMQPLKPAKYEQQTPEEVEALRQKLDAEWTASKAEEDKLPKGRSLQEQPKGGSPVNEGGVLSRMLRPFPLRLPLPFTSPFVIRSSRFNIPPWPFRPEMLDTLSS